MQVGEWDVDVRGNALARGKEVVRLEPKAIEVLAHLARHAGQVVGREELLAAVWPGVVVGDDALTQAIIKLRKALGDEAQSPRYIETIPKRGYRLVASTAGAPRGTPDEAGRLQHETSRPRRGAVIAVGVAFAALLAGAVVLHRSPSIPWPIGMDAREGSPPAAFPVVAVLPFVSAGDESREYLGGGVTDEVTSGLARFSGLRLISRNAVLAYKGRPDSPQALRDELKARYIVRGNVHEASRKVRISVELSDADKGMLLWSERYEGEGLELFEIQDRIVRDIVAALHVKLTRLEQARAFARPTQSLEAHDLVLQARALHDRVDRSANRKARAQLARAAELSPQYIDILTLSGELEVQRALFGWVEDPAATMQRAEEIARRALASPDSRGHARAHLLLARIQSNIGRPEEARIHADRAVAANPADSEALYWRGVALLYVGQVAEGVAAMESAARFDPAVNPAVATSLVQGYFQLGRHRDALALADTLVTQAPRDVALHALRAASLVRMGEAERAREAAAQVRRVNPHYDVKFVGDRFLRAEHRETFRAALRDAGL